MTTIPARPGETILRAISLALLDELAVGGMTIQSVGTIAASPLSSPAGTLPVFNVPAPPAIVNAGTAVAFWITTDPTSIGDYLLEVPCSLSDGKTMIKALGRLRINRS